jgi:hypothetical protein
MLDVRGDSVCVLGEHPVTALASWAWARHTRAGSSCSKEGLCDHVPRSHSSIHHGPVPCGLVAPPVADGLPSNDALQPTNALWSAASPPFMIGVRS